MNGMVIGMKSIVAKGDAPTLPRLRLPPRRRVSRTTRGQDMDTDTGRKGSKRAGLVRDKDKDTGTTLRTFAANLHGYGWEDDSVSR